MFVRVCYWSIYILQCCFTGTGVIKILLQYQLSNITNGKCGMYTWHCPRYPLVCQKQVSRAGTSNYIPQFLWDIITWPCPRYLLLAYKPIFPEIYYICTQTHFEVGSAKCELSGHCWWTFVTGKEQHLQMSQWQGMLILYLKENRQWTNVLWYVLDSKIIYYVLILLLGFVCIGLCLQNFFSNNLF